MTTLHVSVYSRRLKSTQSAARLQVLRHSQHFRRLLAASLLRALVAGRPVHSEAVHAGVLRVAPVRQHLHLDDLEESIVLLLNRTETDEGSGSERRQPPQHVYHLAVQLQHVYHLAVQLQHVYHLAVQLQHQYFKTNE